MDREVIIQYCGPYLIQTTDAIMEMQAVESTHIIVERGLFPEVELPVSGEMEGELENMKDF
jgi:hypothetical protein